MYLFLLDNIEKAVS